jgi:hypothetical protein
VDHAFCILGKASRPKRHAVVAAPIAADAAATPVAVAAMAPAPTTAPVPVRAPPCAVAPPVGMVLSVVGINAGDRGCHCKEHNIYGCILEEDVGVRFRKERIVVPDLLAGKAKTREQTTITLNWVTDGVDVLVCIPSDTTMSSMRGCVMVFSAR